jgi:hypothetical protein
LPWTTGLADYLATREAARTASDGWVAFECGDPASVDEPLAEPIAVAPHLLLELDEVRRVGVCAPIFSPLPFPLPVIFVVWTTVPDLPLRTARSELDVQLPVAVVALVECIVKVREMDCDLEAWATSGTVTAVGRSSVLRSSVSLLPPPAAEGSAAAGAPLR